ncbi:hypothetical protein [Glutamicibacter sp.]|uniref:hypothetical protein n=1 Tax=Glutamicibacter sp. TaxID=1931995 RepID=UPI0028BEEE78|nr:hypothetical protein [Glutamicibacter sp.]
MQGQTLASLIEEARYSSPGKPLSYDSLAKACGGKPSAGRLQQIVSGKLKNFPDPESIQGLMSGTGRTAEEIVLASARSLGLPVGDNPSDSVFVPGLSALPESALEVVKSLTRELVNLSRKADHAEAADPHATTQRPQLRAVAPIDHPSKGQKTKSDDYPKPNDIVYELDKLGIKQLHAGDPEATEAPEDVAAYPNFETQREKFERIHGERGEESQDPGDSE